uniref:Transcription factor Iwr1 domain-containing protein n=1 Tax=Romanomermis culicivorax TaxID=13658 RepID=A0A915J8U2_ROMCU
MTNVVASTSCSLPSLSTPKIFRLKRKIDDDPLSTLALSIKKSRKSSDFKIQSDSQPKNGSIIYDVLHLTASSSCPIAPEYSNVDYHDLNIIDDQSKTGIITDVDIPSYTHSEASNDIQGEDFDLSKIDPHLDQQPSSPNKRRKFCRQTTENALDNDITCNGRPMFKFKKENNHQSCNKSDYVYDFYVPKSYNVFKDGLPDKITCRVDTENLIDGVISLNACDNFDDNNGCFYDDQHFSSLYLAHNESSNSASSYFDPYYYRNERDIDRMYDSNLQSENQEKRLQKNVKFSDLLLEKSNWRRPLEDNEDEDSNDENNYKNDYPDEDEGNSSSEDDDIRNFHVFKERRSKNDDDDDEEEEKNLENYLDDGDMNLMSKFDDFYLENY